MRLTVRVFALLLVVTFSALAQGPPPVERLPEDTVFFLAWHGTAAIERARATNSLLRLWNDVELQTAMETLMRGAERRAEKTASKAPEPDAKTRAQMAAFFSLARNPLILGWAGLPEAKGAKPAAPVAAEPAAPEATGEPRKRTPTNVFVIYDTTGKAEALKEFTAQAYAQAAEKPALTKSRFSGVEIVKEETAKSTSYGAYVEHYYVHAERKEVIEQLITRLQGVAPAGSVISTAAFQSVKAHQVPDSFLEIFGKIPDLSKMDFPPAQGFNFAATLKELHIERLQTIGGSASVAGDGTRMRMAVLGDTAPGSFFDLMGENGPTFSTLAAAPAGAAYSAMRIDLGAFYKTLRAAIIAGLPPEQAGMADVMEGMAGTQLGMGIHEALSLIKGELATISTGEGAAGLDPLSDVYALSIERPEEVLKLARLVLGTNITSETSEGTTTFLAMTTPYRDPKTGVQRSRFQHLAIAPKILLFGPRKAQLKEMLARYADGAATPPAGSLAADPGFQRVRPRLAPSLAGLSYTDFSKVPMDTIIETVIKQSASDAKPEDQFTPEETEALKSLPKIIARYLRTAFGGWTKERNGLFMDSFIE